MLAWRRIGMVHREILRGRAEGNGRKIRLLVVVPGTSHELNDLGNHEHSSDMAMTTRRMSASDIRQAVIGISPRIEMCGMIAVQAQIIWGANLIPSGAACGGDDPRRRPTCSRMPANCVKARTTRSRRPGGGVGSCGVDVRPPSDSRIPNKKARGGFLRAGFAIFVMMYFCP